MTELLVVSNQWEHLVTGDRLGVRMASEEGFSLYLLIPCLMLEEVQHCR